MDDAADVRELDREADLGERAEQALAPELVAPELVHRDDGGVIQPRLDPRLAEEAVDVGIGRVVGVEPPLPMSSPSALADSVFAGAS